VAAFLQSRIAFTSIPEVIRQSMEEYDRHGSMPVRGLDDVRAIDLWSRDFALRHTQGELSAVEDRDRIGG
jgi:1-deoxy-D-xylulose 5-phosphate reductoisomerase